MKTLILERQQQRLLVTLPFTLMMLRSMTTYLFCDASSSSGVPMELSSENLDQLTEEKAVFLMVRLKKFPVQS